MRQEEMGAEEMGKDGVRRKRHRQCSNTRCASERTLLRDLVAEHLTLEPAQHVWRQQRLHCRRRAAAALGATWAVLRVESVRVAENIRVDQIEQ
jgi:D-mannonate dehydratase